MQYVSGITRTCCECGERFLITKQNVDDAIYYDKSTYHSGCFINMANRKAQSKRGKPQKWQEALNNIGIIKHNSLEHFSEEIAKNDVFEFILEHYGLTIVPTTVWHRLADVYKGTYYGMSVPIPPSHLLDMWTKKINKLNDIASQNETKGKVMRPDQRIKYDLAILINKYDSYLKWLNEQKIISANNKTKVEMGKSVIGTDILRTKANESQVNRENNDISDLVDDIFDES